MEKRGGRFQDWDVNLTSQQRGGVYSTPSGIVVPSSCRPDRIVTEVRTLRKYPFEAGWLLERWVPSIYYGSKQSWEDRCVPGTTVPLGGPYPLHGDFEMCHYAASIEVPSITELQNAIDRCERARENRHTDVEQLVLEKLNRAEDEYHKQLQKEEEETRAMIHDAISVLNGTSLSAGAYRTKLAEEAGIRTHEGN